MDQFQRVIVDDVDAYLLDALGDPPSASGRMSAEGWRISQDIAGPAADDVDANARFPQEAVSAMREAGLLGALVPRELGGAGASMGDVAGAVRALACHCTSSALVLAMHSIEVFNLIKFGTTPALRELLGKIARDGLLLANANSEVGLGGDVTRSKCALERRGAGWHIEKDALAVSYGAHADIIISIARSNEDAPETEQAMFAIPTSAASLEPLNEWNTMGLRGTCSSGYHISADVPESALYPVPFSEIANDGAGQARQLFICAAWVGLAEAAAAKAHAFVRGAARKSIGTLPPSAVRLSELADELQQSRSLLASTTLQYMALANAGDATNAALVGTLRELKVTTSQIAVNVATAALSICGMAGFSKDTPFALDRIVRDAHGALVMVSNERLILDNAQLLIARKGV